MANKKFTDLDNLATPAGADVIAIVDDVAGTPTTKKVTATNLMTLAPVQSVAGRTGTVTLSNTDVSGLGTAATQDVGTSNGNVVQLDATGLPVVDGSQLTGIVVTDESLRGTANPHIGAFSNQSLKVLDSQPSGSAFMVADESSLKFLVGSSANVFVVKGTGTASRLAEASELPSFSISKDSGEPDIELTDSDGEVYSIVNGDSDTVGANGLPVRQGYQIPNIGANPSPLLISGGTIS